MILRQNLMRDNFLKVSCNVKYETAISELFVLCYNKLSVSLTFWMDLPPISDFITTCIDDVENSSLSYVDLSNFDKFHCTISKKKNIH